MRYDVVVVDVVVDVDVVVVVVDCTWRNTVGSSIVQVGTCRSEKDVMIQITVRRPCVSAA